MSNDKITLSPAFEQNNVPVIIAANNLWAPYAGVFIRSLLDHAGEDNHYDIIIFNRDISEENKRLLKNLAAGCANVSVRFYDPTPVLAAFHFTHDDDTSLFPVEVYYRIIAPHLLNYPGRIIAVDIDTLLRTDIARLMDEDLDGCGVGGVCSVDINGMYACDYTLSRMNFRMRDYFRNNLGFGPDDLESYVSAGLLLFDCDEYVRDLDMKTIFDAAQQGGYISPEQDTLNVLMKGKIKLLDLAWNVVVPSNLNTVKLLDAGSKQCGGGWERAYENPCLLHWGGRPKPWVCPDVPWGGEWWQTALRTPFVGHIIARMTDEQEKRRAYYRKRYGKENVDVWDPVPKGIDRT